MQTKTKLQLSAGAILVVWYWWHSQREWGKFEETSRLPDYEPGYRLQIQRGKHEAEQERQSRLFDEKLKQKLNQSEIDNAWKAAKGEYDRILFDRKLNNIPFNVYTDPQLRNLRREIEELEKKGVSSDAQMDYLEQQVGKLKR